MRLVLLGPPGAGKGTQSQFLTERLRVPRVATGDMLRDAAEQGTPTGIEAKRYTDQGQLVPDDTILALVRERLSQPDARAGYLLDGFPRTVVQADALGAWLNECGHSLDAVVDIEVPTEQIVERLSNRRECPSCHAVYHLINRPPKVDSICDVCGHALIQRDDDRAETIRERLRIYHQRTEPVVDYYRSRGLLITLPGDRPVHQVTESILEAIREKKDA